MPTVGTHAEDDVPMRVVPYAISFILVASITARGQISEQDISGVISAYQKVTVSALKDGMPPPQTDIAFRKSIYQSLPEDVVRLRITDPKLVSLLKKVLEPVLSLYGRGDVYDLVIVNSPVPMMMSDTGVVLVMTTGMIQQAESDDELLGAVAHEVGHEYFVFYSVESRQLLKTISNRGREQPLERRISEVLNLIELQCDAFSAITLSSLGYDSLAFIRAIERVQARYPKEAWGNHPVVETRRKVIEGLMQSHEPRRSDAFIKLQKLTVDKSPLQ